MTNTKNKSKKSKSVKRAKSWTPKQWAKFHDDLRKILSSMSKELVGIKMGLVQVEKEMDEQDAAYAKAAAWLDLANSDSDGPFADADDQDGDQVPAEPSDNPQASSVE